MKLPEAIKVLRVNTMACWWPNGPYPGKRGTDFEGILGEVGYLLLGIRRRQNIPDDAMFYTLDPDNSETTLYDQLTSAVIAIKRTAQV